MTVTIRPYERSQRGGWEVDICMVLPDGSEARERRRAPVSAKQQAQRWGEARERQLLQDFLTRPANETRNKEVPTLREFATRFIEEHAEANRQKPSGIYAKKSILRLYLEPLLGAKRLDDIKSADVQRLKRALRHLAPKTVNNVLTVLGKLLRVAVAWDVLAAMPCRIELLKSPKPEKSFYELDELARLLEAAGEIDAGARLLVLLGADAGLRRGEIVSLRWGDVDLVRREIAVRRADWNGIESLPKSGKGRTVELTSRLASALKQHRHQRSERVLCEADGTAITAATLSRWMRQATRRAGVKVAEGPHILRHTFCSHLAMRGAPLMAIKELAGHQDVSTTMGYMHLSPNAKRGAIALLEGGASDGARGEILEQADRDPETVSNSR